MSPASRLRAPPDGFVDLARSIPGLRLDIRYHTADNFFGEALPGYGAPGAWLLTDVAPALLPVQQTLAARGLGLLVFDAYRPRRAVRAMVAWLRAHDRADLLDGYVSENSRHMRGTSVDVGLVDASGAPLDMGSPFDCFDERGHTLNAEGIALERRLLLRDLMREAGWDDYRREWWHFERAVPDARPRDVPYGADEPDEGA